ncbi:hypothetical protein GQ44DRAFT_832385 [Phaeosphaeriaceae sp. PMI808]|nr:hypothetical protein GQ44DRAFT_832385 [Phaeosphaeriaceae sp. PMI808]
MLKLLSTVLVFAQIVLSAQLALRSELIPRQGTCPSDAPVSCGGGFCRPSDATCCSNGHYCPAGQFCAPVVGYCCRNGEDPATCAVRQNFSLPATAAASTPAVVAPSAPPGVPSSPPAVTPTPSAATITTATSTTPVVQFTGAAEKKDSAAGAILMGVIGLMAVL